MEQPYAIEMLNITKRFPGIVANDNITLQLKRGEIPSSCKDSDPYLMLPAKFTVMVVAGMAEMSLETVTSPSYMAFTRAL